MKLGHLFAVAVFASVAVPLAAQAQGVPDGIAHGAAVGNQAAGPVGAVVGGAVGGVVGGVEGVLGIRPTEASYPEAAPPRRVYRRWHHVRHSYRHLPHPHYSNG